MTGESTADISHEAVRSALEALFVDGDRQDAFGELSAHQIQRHLAACGTCRRHYDAIALVDRALAAGPEADKPALLESSSFEAGFGEAAFMGALDEMLADEEAASVGESGEVVSLSEQRDRRWGRRAAFGAVAAILAIVAGVWLLPRDDFGSADPARGDAQFQPRSAASTPGQKTFTKPRLELFCARRTGEDVEFRGTKDAPFGLLGCPVDAELKLAYANASERLTHAAFFGVGHDGTIYWYGPTPADHAPIEARQSAELTPFGESIRLEVNHRPGRVRVYGVFATEPIDFLQLSRLVERSEPGRLFGGQGLDEAPAPGTWTSQVFEITDGGDR